MTTASLPYPEPALNDGVVGLRRWSEDDVDCVRQASADPRIPAGTTVPAEWSPEEGIAFIQRQWSRADSGVGLSLAVVPARLDRAVGLVIVSMRPQPGVAGIGYWIVPAARSAGYATRAVGLLTGWALSHLGVHRVEAWVEPDNLSSRQVLQRNAFVEEGRLRRFLTVGDRTTDALVYSRVVD